MAFDDIRLPLRVTYGSNGGPEFFTDVVTVAGGYERRNQNWAQPRRKYDARTGVTSVQEASHLMHFFHARAGRARGFRLKDWFDYTSHADGVSSHAFDDQIIGIGDGVQNEFQLIKKYGDNVTSYVRNITKPVEGSIKVGVNDIEYQTEWSVDVTSGVVTFAQAPANGMEVTAGFIFDVPVRFDTDQLNIISSHPKLSEAQTPIPLIEIRTS